MPRTKKKTVARKVLRSKRTSAKSSRAKRLAAIHRKFGGWKWTESYNSLLLGIVVVIIAVLFVASFMRQTNKIQQTSSLLTAPTLTPTPAEPGATYKENGNTYYIVKQNDSLWTIAVHIYNNGYKWTEIAKTNNLSRPGTIFTGDKLLLPNAPAPSTLGQINAEQQAQENSITGDSYTVQKGDTLWSIAVRAYADGYKWTEIAKTNNLSNPDLIFSGNVLMLPR